MVESNFGTLLESRVRVVTWNIWWRFGPWEQRQGVIIETLRAVDPDIVCLQEVWVDLATGDSSAHHIAAALGFEHAVVAQKAVLDGVGFGNAILSRWPLAGHEWRPLPQPDDFPEDRVVLRADVDGPRGPLQVFTTHLHWRLDHSHIRQDQVREICAFVADSPARTYPAVLTGDFNADPRSDEVRMLTGRAAVPSPPVVFFDAWEVAGETTAAHPHGDTWSNTNDFARRDLEFSRRIDYVFTGFPKAGGAGHVTRAALVGTEPFDGLFGSDHYGVVADLRY